MGSNNVGLDFGKRRGKVVMGLEHFLLKIHSLYSQAVLFLKVLKAHVARPDHCENK